MEPYCQEVWSARLLPTGAPPDCFVVFFTLLRISEEYMHDTLSQACNELLCYDSADCFAVLLYEWNAGKALAAGYHACC